MILVADAGSTKTSWALISREGADYAQTKGIHALLHSAANIKKEIEKALEIFSKKEEANTIDAVYFFGAGCQNTETSIRLNELFAPYFPKAKLQFKSDMEAACMATSVNNDSWVFILGTGSNSCIWKNNTLLAQVPSGGYILGDEGSGAYLGKKLLSEWMRKKLPHDLEENISQTYHLTYDHLINMLYRTNSPNTYLASFVPFIHQYKSHAFMHSLIKQAFNDLKQAHETYLLHSKICIPTCVSFVGSVAYFFRDELREVFSSDYLLNQVVQRPIEGLVKYYQQQLSAT